MADLTKLKVGQIKRRLEMVREATLERMWQEKALEYEVARHDFDPVEVDNLKARIADEYNARIRAVAQARKADRLDSTGLQLVPDKDGKLQQIYVGKPVKDDALETD